MKHLKLLAMTFMALMMVSVTGMAHGTAKVPKNPPASKSTTPSLSYGRISFKRLMSISHCKGHAKVSMKKSGFKIDRVGRSFVVGIKGSYKGTILCLSTRSAIAMASGSKFGTAASYASRLKLNFPR